MSKSKITIELELTDCKVTGGRSRPGRHRREWAERSREAREVARGEEAPSLSAASRWGVSASYQMTRNSPPQKLVSDFPGVDVWHIGQFNRRGVEPLVAALRGSLGIPVIRPIDMMDVREGERGQPTGELAPRPERHDGALARDRDPGRRRERHTLLGLREGAADELGRDRSPDLAPRPISSTAKVSSSSRSKRGTSTTTTRSGTRSPSG